MGKLITFVRKAIIVLFLNYIRPINVDTLLERSPAKADHLRKRSHEVIIHRTPSFWDFPRVKMSTYGKRWEVYFHQH